MREVRTGQGARPVLVWVWVGLAMLVGLGCVGLGCRRGTCSLRRTPTSAPCPAPVGTNTRVRIAAIVPWGSQRRGLLAVTGGTNVSSVAEYPSANDATTAEDFAEDLKSNPDWLENAYPSSTAAKVSMNGQPVQSSPSPPPHPK